MKKIHIRKPRRLIKQQAWYYLPERGEPYLSVYIDGGGRVHLPIKKLMRELNEAVKLMEAK